MRYNEQSEEKKVERILRQVARKEGVTVAQVRGEIDNAIQQAITIAKRENNQHALGLWRKVPCKGEIPTAEELIPWIAGYMREKFNGM